MEPRREAVADDALEEVGPRTQRGEVATAAELWLEDGDGAENDAGDGGGEGGGPACSHDAPAPAAPLPEDEHPVEENVGGAAEGGGESDEARAVPS